MEGTSDLLPLHMPRQQIRAMKGPLTPWDFTLVRRFWIVIQFVPSTSPIISTSSAAIPYLKGVKYTDDALPE